ncbi:MAG: hypothetical protein COU35_05170 [Candidatus Magasanikbacteria bacterium CG10_big_fil_rev_8_21_14_0_10_47_10]|uniref:Uncharacterized protein n=1 Tax=Candidatus Magasanikbacteria bacterium CG10_big_fil_rev_8_21_14_0_10_47_10 TaxID=1974652 RepID=A0A2H0TQX1_9BACT|nr:MAG: hypothetical protein COU35_05170 [Candidatus Magasanikbacteria bacterium CG10_big_fil_rev_8_21_14_0_10_47_10]
MRQQANSGAYGYHIIGILLGIIGLLIILIFVSLRSQADDTTSQASITNEAPTISNVIVAASSQGSSLGTFNTSENASTNIYVRGDITDNNGCVEVDDGITQAGELRVLLYRTGATCTGQIDWDERNCYLFENTNQSNYDGGIGSANYDDGNGVTSDFTGCTQGTDITMSFEMKIPTSFNIDANIDWVASAMVGDTVDFTFGPTSTSDTFTVATLSALDIDTAFLDFGTLSVGSTSTEQTVVVTNTGNNDSLDIQLSGTNMPCSIGTIATDNIRYSSSVGFAWTAGTQLESASASFGVPLAKSTVTTTASTDDSYWKLEVPVASSTGFSGACSGTITFTAS